MDLTGQEICKTYPKLIQIDTGSNTIQDGLGNVILILPTTASYAVTASYALNSIIANIDGGAPDSVYGGILTTIDGGGI